MLIILFVSFLGIAHCISLGPEPKCSRFHYEEQLLEKMIRMEIKVEEIEKRISKTNQNVIGVLEDIKKEREIMKNDNHELQMNYSKEMEERLTDVSVMKEDLKKDRDNMINVNHELQMNYTKEMEERMTVMKETMLTETIAFKARGPANKSPVKGQTIIFQHIMLNKGGAYDNVTGVFKAPVSGTYIFMIQLCVNPGTNMYYGIMVDDTVVTSGIFYDSDSSVCYTADAVVVLNGGERIYAKCLYSSSTLFEHTSTTYNYWNTFSGLLVHR